MVLNVMRAGTFRRRWCSSPAMACLAFAVLVAGAAGSITTNEPSPDVIITDSPIPIVDISPWVETSSHSESERLVVAQQIGRACEQIGFFAVVGHGVNHSVLSEAWNVTQQFFDLPLDEKLRSSGNVYGYEHSETLSLGKAQDSSSSTTAAPPDLKETFSIGPDNPLSGMPARQFPPRPPELKKAYEQYYHSMEALATILLRIFAVALNLPGNWFGDKMDHHMCALRVLNYPDLGNADPMEGQLRAGAHTDYGALTILRSGGPGLQVTKDGKTSQDWVDVPHLPNGFIINLGDLMRRWTNDKWVSTLHRVVVPPKDGRDQRRQSMAFFVNVNGDADVVPIETCVNDENPAKYGSITAGEHLMSKHLASMGIPADDSQDEL